MQELKAPLKVEKINDIKQLNDIKLLELLCTEAV